MRHRNKINSLGRKSQHRKAMLANMACSLIEHKRINTTVAKAKALKRYIEPLITKSKNDTTHSRRTVFSSLQNKYAVSELFREVAPKVADRPGGYTRIIKTGYRLGDAADMCMIELVDFNDIYVKEGSSDTGKKTRRSRRGGGSKAKTSTSGGEKKQTTEKKQEENTSKEQVEAKDNNQKEVKPVEEAETKEEEVKEEPKKEDEKPEVEAKKEEPKEEKKEETNDDSEKKGDKKSE